LNVKNDEHINCNETINIKINPKILQITEIIVFHTKEKWFINLSNIHIPSEVINLLQLGEGFSISIFSEIRIMVTSISQNDIRWTSIGVLWNVFHFSNDDYVFWKV